MSLPRISISRPVFAWMLMIGLMFFGWLCFKRMGISQLPDVDFPVVTINLTLSNAAPEVMENDVIDPLEDAVMGIEGIRNVSSTCSQGAASVTIEFELNRNIDVALQEVQTRISQAAKKLPSQLDPPVVTKTNPEDQPIMWLMLTADKEVPLSHAMSYARNILKNNFSTISGVGSISFAGYVDPNLRVWLDPKKLKQFALTPDDITNAISAEQIEQPAGRIENEKKEINIRMLGEASTPEEFSKIQINNRAGNPNYRPISLGEVARIEEGLADIRAISRFNGKIAVGLGIIKQRGSNAVAVSELVHQKVKQIEKSLPAGMHLELKLDSTEYIRDSVNELNFTLILSAILTSVVCFLFLGSFSSTINVLFSIPTSILGAFIFLYFFGFTLNTFTLLGLSLAIGIVVDDAIMMLENIVRHFEMGKNKVKAALEGAEEISFAAIAATMAIAAIFIPVIFMKGIIGKFFFQFGITVTVAVFLSLLEALTLTPMRCAEMGGSLAPSKDSNKLYAFVEHWLERLTDGYQKLLVITLKYKKLVILVSSLIFLASLTALGPMRKELMPDQDSSLFVLYVKTAIDSSINSTDKKVLEVEKYLRDQKEVKDIYTTIGGYQGQDIVNIATIYVTLTDPKDRKLTQRQVMDKVGKELNLKVSNVDIYSQDLSLNGFSASRGYPIEFTIQGSDWNKLVELSKVIKDKLNATNMVTDLNTDYQGKMPEYEIVPNRASASDRGVSIASMSTSVSTLIGGTVFNSGTQYPKDGHRYDIRIRSEDKFHGDEKDINDVLIRNNRGANTDLVPLSQVASVQNSSALQSITRLNRERAIPFYANVKVGQSQQSVLAKVEQIAKENLPPGYHINVTGGAATFRDSFSGLFFALILGVMVAYMVLATQFNSFIHPLTVLLALPFSLTGAFLSLLLTGNSLNLFSMIGLILLMGIVKKNSILLVDFTNEKRSEGHSVEDALLQACPIRLRPILMTSIACIAGAIPAAIAFGPGSETRAPMAIAIIGGVALSTFLTLFVVPCAYSLMSRFEHPRRLEDLE